MLAPREFPFQSRQLTIDAVQTVYDIRHANLLLLKKRAGNSVTTLALEIDRSHSQISQLLNRSKHTKSKKPREIGDELARHIEHQCDLPRGWMDQPHLAAPPSKTQTLRVVAQEPPPLPDWPFATINPTAYLSLSAADRARIEAFAQALLDTANQAGTQRIEA